MADLPKKLKVGGKTYQIDKTTEDDAPVVLVKGGSELQRFSPNITEAELKVILEHGSSIPGDV